MSESHYVVTFRDPDKNTPERITSLKARTITDSNLGLGFICVSNFIFSSSSGIVVDPTSDALRARYEHTKSLHLGLHQILAVEEVGDEHPGLTLTTERSNLLNLPPRHEH